MLDLPVLRWALNFSAMGVMMGSCWPHSVLNFWLPPELPFSSPEHEKEWSAKFDLALAGRLIRANTLDRKYHPFLFVLAVLGLSCVWAQNLSLFGPLFCWVTVVITIGVASQYGIGVIGADKVRYVILLYTMLSCTVATMNQRNFWRIKSDLARSATLAPSSCSAEYDTDRFGILNMDSISVMGFGDEYSEGKCNPLHLVLRGHAQALVGELGWYYTMIVAWYGATLQPPFRVQVQMSLLVWVMYTTSIIFLPWGAFLSQPDLVLRSYLMMMICCVLSLGSRHMDNAARRHFIDQKELIRDRDARIEAERKAMEAAIREADAERTLMAYMCHEIRNPLNGIAGSLEQIYLGIR
jgi:hypothetical protein